MGVGISVVPDTNPNLPIRDRPIRYKNADLPPNTYPITHDFPKTLCSTFYFDYYCPSTRKTPCRLDHIAGFNRKCFTQSCLYFKVLLSPESRWLEVRDVMRLMGVRSFAEERRLVTRFVGKYGNLANELGKRVGEDGRPFWTVNFREQAGAWKMLRGPVFFRGWSCVVKVWRKEYAKDDVSERTIVRLQVPKIYELSPADKEKPELDQEKAKMEAVRKYERAKAKGPSLPLHDADAGAGVEEGNEDVGGIMKDGVEEEEKSAGMDAEWETRSAVGGFWEVRDEERWDVTRDREEKSVDRKKFGGEGCVEGHEDLSGVRVGGKWKGKRVRFKEVDEWDVREFDEETEEDDDAEGWMSLSGCSDPNEHIGPVGWEARLGEVKGDALVGGEGERKPVVTPTWKFEPRSVGGVDPVARTGLAEEGPATAVERGREVRQRRDEKTWDAGPRREIGFVGGEGREGEGDLAAFLRSLGVVGDDGMVGDRKVGLAKKFPPESRDVAPARETSGPEVETDMGERRGETGKSVTKEFMAGFLKSLKVRKEGGGGGGKKDGAGQRWSEEGGGWT
ncbi:hypothetical protein HK097_000678 [Rhizophlyctis rosea]|uniref:Uncharacterized protein n=1 Tax=Rhizophlyctis rosea TaxID=64517 RepID=A0AAD5X199_9FUNG|nr:hypothetical protein HK097_000678 [Rhizophlyctis rosea]